MKSARFPADTDLAGFDFANSEINEALVRQLYFCRVMDGAHNVGSRPAAWCNKSGLTTVLTGLAGFVRSPRRAA